MEYVRGVARNLGKTVNRVLIEMVSVVKVCVRQARGLSPLGKLPRLAPPDATPEDRAAIDRYNASISAEEKSVHEEAVRLLDRSLRRLSRKKARLH